MFRTRYFRFLIIAAAAAAAACTADLADPADSADSASTEPIEDAEPASLTINFSIADLGIDVSTRGAGTGPVTGSVTGTGMGTRATRGVSGTLCDDVFGSADMIDPDNLAKKEDYNDNPEKKYRWTEAALVNGSKMTCLTVILIHRRSNRIVGVRRIPDPDCPDFDVVYPTTNPVTNQDSGQNNESVTYPPDEGSDLEKEMKLNCILDENGKLAPILRDVKGNPVIDNPVDNHIAGLFGSQACVTFDYEHPIHVVEEKDVMVDGKVPVESQQYLGKSAEKLLRGEYTVLAIANYDHRVTTASDEDVDGADFPTLNVDKTLETIVNDFHQPKYTAEGIPNFNPNYAYLYNLRFLMNRTLDGDNQVVKVGPFTDKDGKQVLPYIRPAVHQTLTAAKDVYLEAGNNVLDMELLRIASRTRVEVKNYAKEPLQVNSLKFSPNYTQSTCYLFRRNKVNRDYSELASKKDDTAPGNTGKFTDHDGKGAPMVEYTGIYNYFNGETYGAIVPFVKDWNSDGKDGMDGVRVEGVASGKNKRCIFDALMYESHLDYKDKSHTPEDDDSFYYTIDVSYPTVNNYNTTDLNKLDKERPYSKIGYEYLILNSTNRYLNGFGNVTALYNQIAGYKDGYFLIQGLQSGKYVYENAEGRLCAASLADGTSRLDLKAETIRIGNADIDIKRFLWCIEVGDGNCKSIKNLGTGNYMPEIPQNGGAMWTTTSAHEYQLHVSDSNAAFSNTIGQTPYYLNVYAGGDNMSGYSGLDAGSRFRLYPVKDLYAGTPRMTKTVELTAFSDATGYVEKVREIQRNDFIRILVDVSYNTENGVFDFQVNEWDNREGNVEFH